MAGLAGAAPPEWARTGPSPDAVGLRNFPFDVSKGPPAVPPGLSGVPKPGAPAYVIVKFKDKFNADDRVRLSGSGIRFYGYIPVNGFLAKVPPGLRDGIEADPAVAFVADFLPAYRLDTVTLGWAVGDEAGAKKLLVQVFDDEPLAPVMDAIEGIGGSAEVYADRPGRNGKFLKVLLDASRIPDLAAVDGVQWVEPEPVFIPFNDRADAVTNVETAWTLPVPLKGTGQVVAVCDTGLDTGSTSTLHADFSGTTSDGNPKLKAAFGYGRPGIWSDTHGHGTHTSGSVLGSGAKSIELTPSTPIKGMAYDAQLVIQSMLDSNGNFTSPDLYSKVFPDAYAQGARVHSNSWGSNSTAYNGDYTSSSMIVDQYAWEHKDFLAVFSSGNFGVDLSPKDGVTDVTTNSPPSTAKNALSVGASENNRPELGLTYFTAFGTDFTVNPIRNDDMADEPWGMVAFSGRGPCDDGRIKPDIVAPGTFVLSTKSSLAPSGNYWSTASAIGYSSSLDPYYASNGGTSMSAPLVAGAAALVRQRLLEDGMAVPSAALVKALLIAGAYDMTPGQYASPDNDVTARPDMNQGWGRLDVKGTLFPDAPSYVAYVDEQQGLNTGFSAGYTYTIADATVPLRVNLVWTDFQGTTVAGGGLVDDLDLIVTAPNGTIYHGNMYTGSSSTPNPPDFDGENNVEGVTVPAASLTTGTLEITVYAASINNDIEGDNDLPQPYALVLSGGIGLPPSVTSVLPDSGMNHLATPVTVTGTGFANGCTVKVGTILCTVNGVTETSIDASVPSGIATGTYNVTVTNPDNRSGTLTDGFTVTEDTTPPGAPQGLAASPGDSSVNLKWTPPSDADLAGYRVHFNTYSTAVSLVEMHRLDGLTNGTSYDIYFQAEDLAGNLSQPSATVSATPYSTVSELPHYDWDLSPAWACGSCHIEPSGGLLPPGFDYRNDEALCLSCHNQASSGHRSPVKSGRSHAAMSNYTAAGSTMPTFGSATSGEYSDTMYTHLMGGDTVVCTTCHNAMRKPHDTGRYWEPLYPQGGQLFSSYRGGWWDRGHTEVRAYRDTSAGTPQYSRSRDELRLSDPEFNYDDDAGTLSFQSITSGYVYLSLVEPYLRAPGFDNTFCLDCHPQDSTHRDYNCLACHEMHDESFLAFVRKSVRRPDGTSAQIVFTAATGAGSYADGNTTYDGICEVCHTLTAYYRNDGSVLNTHTSTGMDYSGTDCTTVCHTHGGGFSPQ